MNLTRVDLRLTIVVSGTTPEALRAHIEDVEQDICCLCEENLNQTASLEGLELRQVSVLAKEVK